MSLKYSIDEIKNLAIQRGFSLESKEYVNKHTPLVLNCPNHGNFSITLDVFRRTKYGCSACADIEVSKKNKKNLHDVKCIIEKFGYGYIEQDYVNAKSKIRVNCPKHGEFLISLTNLQNGKKCKSCAKESRSKKNLLDVKEVKKRVIDKGLTPLFDVYNGKDEKFLTSCPEHGEILVNLQSVTYGNGCSKCASGQSKAQQEIYEFILKHYPNTFLNDRTAIGPLEIDIYVPSIKLGIEYCGLRWHSEQFQKNKKYHYEKMKKANDAGIRLITIFEDEWLEKKTQVKGFLLSAMHKNSLNVGARSLELKVVEKKEAIKFLNDHHIQGSTNFIIALGLYKNAELLGVMTGNQHHRQGFDSILVLNRLAFKYDYSVAGGSSRLNKALVKYAQKMGYKKIISWSDNRWSEGNVYNKLGYELTENLLPDYSYVRRDQRESKQANKKANLKKKGGVGKTEHEMALSIGMYRIWDCGKKRWEMNV